MAQVIRYDPEARCCLGMEDQVVMNIELDGDYVKYEAWEDIQGEFIMLVVKYNNLVEKLGDVYQEA